LCGLAGVSPTTLSRMSSEDLEELRIAKENLPLYVCHDVVDFDVLQVEVEKVINQHPGKRTLLIIDSIQALPGDADSKRYNIDNWLVKFDSLKLKHKHQLVTLLISEKNRSSYGQATKAGGKESGTIEYKCEQLFDMRVDPESGLIHFECVANRHGLSNIKTQLAPAYDKSGNGFTFLLKETGIDI